MNPTSEEYGLSEVIYFKLRLHKPLNEISEVDHFSLSFIEDGNDQVYYNVLKTFKIFERYRYHKKDALHLVRKKLDYPNSQISEIAAISCISEDEVKKCYLIRSYLMMSLVKNH